MLDRRPPCQERTPHPTQCPLCDKEEENNQNLLTCCVFARQVWLRILAPLGFTGSSPEMACHFIADWHRRIIKVPKDKKKGTNTLIIILAVWSRWKHKNSCASWYYSSSSMKNTICGTSQELGGCVPMF